MLPGPETNLGGFDRRSRVFREGSDNLLVPPFLYSALLRVEAPARARVLPVAEELTRDSLAALAQVLLQVADVHDDVGPPRP